MSFKFDDRTCIHKSLSFEILGYGLILDHDGSEALLATSVDDFIKIMRFGFDSMVKTKTIEQDPATNNEETSSYSSFTEPGGLVYKVEVVPWSENNEFFYHAEIASDKVFIPVPRNQIESAKSGSNNPCPADYAPEPDDFGRCCNSRDMVNISRVDEMGQVVQQRKCEPKREVSAHRKQQNLKTNAEFVSWLASVKEQKEKSLNILSKCINNLRALPPRFDYKFLLSNYEASYDASMDLKYTVKELKAALDPATSLEILSLISNENDEFMEMFYQPCLSALNGRSGGGYKQQPDSKYIMAKPWYNHKECSRTKCMRRNMAWDRISGKECVPSILGLRNGNYTIPGNNDPHCAKTIDSISGEARCKYGSESMNIFMMMNNCREVLPHGYDGRGNPIKLPISELMDYFCLPKVAVDRDPADASKMDEVDEALEICVSLSN